MIGDNRRVTSLHQNKLLYQLCITPIHYNHLQQQAKCIFINRCTVIVWSEPSQSSHAQGKGDKGFRLVMKFSSLSTCLSHSDLNVKKKLFHAAWLPLLPLQLTSTRHIFITKAYSHPQRMLPNFNPTSNSS